MICCLLLCRYFLLLFSLQLFNCASKNLINYTAVWKRSNRASNVRLITQVISAQWTKTWSIPDDGFISKNWFSVVYCCVRMSQHVFPACLSCSDFFSLSTSQARILQCSILERSVGLHMMARNKLPLVYIALNSLSQ